MTRPSSFDHAALVDAIDKAVASLIEGRVAQASIELGDYDERRDEIGAEYHSAEVLLTAALGAPVPNSAAVDRAVRVTTWRSRDRRFVAALTTHDAGTLTFLELAAVPRTDCA